MFGKDKKKKPKKVTDATVIDQELLKKAVKDYLHENKILQKEAVNLANIKHLSLSFQNIWKIQYLQCLDKLEKLQLDNNIIQKIENLDHLVNLKWLDLSFNNISKIQGLDSLINLTDLSLYNNKIIALEGLQNCSKLNVFSIGNNHIKTFQQFLSYFGKGPEKRTKFKYLQVLNVYGNPFTIKQNIKDTEYQNHLISHLPNLRYLDYIFIDDQKRKNIRELDDKFKTQDQAKYLNELKIQQQKEKDNLQEKRKKQAAKMHLIDNFADQLVQEQELQKIHKMRALQDQISKFTQKIKEIVEKIQKQIKQKNEKKLEAIQKFEKSVKYRQTEAQVETIKLIELFQKEKKNITKAIESKKDKHFQRQQIKKLRQKTEILKDKLLNVQIQLAEDVESSFKSFLSKLQQFGKEMENIISGEAGHFKKIDDQIKQFITKLEKISKQQQQAYAKMMSSGDPQQEYSNDAQLNALLENRDTLNGTITSIKQRLGQKKGRVQTQVVQEVHQKDIQNYTKIFNQRQYQRNRKNINNIKEKISNLISIIDNMVVQENQQDAD